jgi:hypothetical protein
MTANRTEIMKLITEDDIVALSWVIAMFRKKLVPFLDEHKDHHPLVCSYADPTWKETIETIAWYLDVIVEGFNEARVEDGNEPVKTFADATLMKGGGTHA